jgi:hypothetical protein
LLSFFFSFFLSFYIFAGDEQVEKDLLSLLVWRTQVQKGLALVACSVWKKSLVKDPRGFLTRLPDEGQMQTIIDTLGLFVQ